MSTSFEAELLRLWWSRGTTSTFGMVSGQNVYLRCCFEAVCLQLVDSGRGNGPLIAEGGIRVGYLVKTRAQSRS